MSEDPPGAGPERQTLQIFTPFEIKAGAIGCGGLLVVILLAFVMCTAASNQSARVSDQEAAGRGGAYTPLPPPSHKAVIDSANAQMEQGAAILALRALVGRAGRDAVRTDPAFRPILDRIRARLNADFGPVHGQEWFDDQLLPPGPRGLDRTAMLAAARAEMAAGHRYQARDIIMANASTEMLSSDAEVRSLLDRLGHEIDVAIIGDRPATYIARLLGYATEQLAALPSGHVLTEAQTVLAGFDAAAGELRNGEEFRSDPAVVRAMATFRANLVRRQVAAFPAIRRAYCAALADRMWVHDGYAACSGGSATTLALTSAVFAANANIQEMYQAEARAAGRLRFQRIEFRWYRGSPSRATYTLQSPTDAAVVVGDNGGLPAIE